MFAENQKAPVKRGFSFICAFFHSLKSVYRRMEYSSREGIPKLLVSGFKIFGDFYIGHALETLAAGFILFLADSMPSTILQYSTNFSISTMHGDIDLEVDQQCGLY